MTEASTTEEFPRFPLDRARDLVEGHATRTPLVPLHRDERGERPGPPPRALLKLESLQVTGSFKVRGAAARILALSERERRRGVVACSSGNHGRAVAHVAAAAGIPAVICVPEWVDPVKLEAIRRAGAEARTVGAGYDEAEEEALALAERSGACFISPFDDPWVIAGQGTLGLELLDDLPGPFTVVGPLSGGGLVGGISLALRRRPSCRLVAVSAERARSMLESLARGESVPLPEEPTLARALSGGIGHPNRHTLELVRSGVAHHLVVDEASIGRAMAFAFRRLGLVLEGGGAVALAAFLDGRFPELVRSGCPEPFVLVLSGGNVDRGTLASVLAEHPDEGGPR